jgi:hypothetical protein
MDLGGGLQAMNRNGQCAMEIDDFTSVSGELWPNLWPASAREGGHGDGVRAAR